MNCKKGGLVLLCHNEVASQWHHLCAQALMLSAVSDKPLILTGQDTSGNGAPTVTPPELCGDVFAHGFWECRMTTIFDVCITDTDVKSNCHYDCEKVLARQEKEKKDKYLKLYLEHRQHFTPLFFWWMVCEGKRPPQPLSI